MVLLRNTLLGGLLFFHLSGTSQAAELTFSAADRILLFVPHPDDEVLCCGGMIQKAVQERIPLQIVVLTYGDNNAWSFTRYHHFPVFRPKTMRAMGELRREETLKATEVLGVSPDQLLFLGYPDFGTLTVWNAHWGDAPAYESRMTRVRETPYATAYRPGAPYKGEEILQDITSIIRDFRPTRIVIPHSADLQTDHRALSLFMLIALWNLAPASPPEIYEYLVHQRDWPFPRAFHPDRALESPLFLGEPREALMFPLTPSQVSKKYEALKKHRTQWAYSRRAMSSYVRSNELFYHVTLSPDPPDTQRVHWQAVIDGTDLLLSGSLSPKLKKSTQMWAAAYGYRQDTSFKQMPKRVVKFRPDDQRRFSVRIPLKTIQQPEKILVGCEIKGDRESFGWDSWQILGVPLGQD